MKKVIVLLLIIFCNNIIYSTIPLLTDDDIIFIKADSGYDFYVKKLEGIESILITESQKDPFMKKTNYAVRTEIFHPANGDEIRILDGKELHTKYDVFFLVDSTTENYSDLGDCFHFFLPEKVLFGYDWSRNGIIKIKPGMKLNLRLFEKNYADYSGNFTDQWINLKIKYSESNYRTNLIEDFKDLTKITNGKEIIKTDKDDLKKIFNIDIPDSIPIGLDADVIFIIDTTESMKEEIPLFKKEFPDIKQKLTDKIKNLRIGIILYKDYGDTYLTKISELSENLTKSDEVINNIIPIGGEDIPEAVNEAICELNNLSFQSKNRYVFLIADAPAHQKPRGKITREDAINVLKEKKIKLITVCFPYK